MPEDIYLVCYNKDTKEITLSNGETKVFTDKNGQAYVPLKYLERLERRREERNGKLDLDAWDSIIWERDEEF